MKKNLPTISLLALCFVLSFGLAIYYFALPAGAQTQDTTERSRQVAVPNPTVSPRPTLGAPPPLPIIDDSSPIIIDTDLVNLSVRVIDRSNRPLNNLRESDFKIYENDIQQKIDSFSKAEVPTNYSLVIDNSGSLRSQLDKVIEASKILVATNRADDETSIIRFVSSDKIEIKQPFTADKEDLFYALDNLYFEGGQTAIIDAVYLAVESVEEYENTVRDDRKRRAIILVSDGEDRASFYKEAQLFELLREANVQIYTVGFVRELESEGGFISKSPQKKAKNFLERLAQETGGKAYFPNSVSELNGIAQDIASELRTQYSISYYPTNDKSDGTYRSIKVFVADGPNKEKRIPITRSGRTAKAEKPKP